MNTDPRPIAVYHEHPDWFRPLFAELDRRGLAYVRLDPRAHSYDPGADDAPYSLLFNRMSPSAYLRGGVQGDFLHPRFSRPSRTARRAGRQRPAGVHRGNVQGAAADAAGIARPALPAGARHQPPVESGVRGGGAALPDRGQGQRRRQRRRHRPLRPARRPRPRRRRGPSQFRRRSYRPGAGIHPGPRRLHHSRRDARRQVPLRHQGPHDRRHLQPLPRRHLPAQRRRRAATHCLPHRRSEKRPESGGVRAAGSRRQRRRADRPGGRHRRGRNRVHHRRPRRPAPVLRR